MGDGNAIFGVFDGHGGKSNLIFQAIKLVNTSSKSLWIFSKTQPVTNPKIIPML
jgi:serine/threonine protein phosphatase PrpC